MCEGGFGFLQAEQKTSSVKSANESGEILRRLTLHLFETGSLWEQGRAVSGTANYAAFLAGVLNSSIAFLSKGSSGERGRMTGGVVG